MTGLNFRQTHFIFYRKFGSVTYQTCAGWIRYPDAGHIENSIFRLVVFTLHAPRERGKVIGIGVHLF